MWLTKVDWGLPISVASGVTPAPEFSPRLPLFATPAPAPDSRNKLAPESGENFVLDKT
jgi:hypothetical protein